MSLIAATLQLFFTDRLIKQRQASPATVRSYRNAFALLLRFVQERTGKAPSALDWNDLGVETISAFLEHLQTNRHNSARSRNARLAALRSLFRYAALRHPEHAQLIAQVLAIPQKRFDKSQVSFLEPEEVDALLAAPDGGRWEGRRDHALIAVDSANRSAAVGADRAPLRRRRAAHRRPRPLHRQGPQGALRPADLGQRRHPAHVVSRARRPLGRPAVSHPHRTPSQRRRGSRKARAPQGCGRKKMPVAPSEATDAARPAAHLCDDTVAPRESTSP